jgi:hypothetical protein
MRQRVRHGRMGGCSQNKRRVATSEFNRRYAPGILSIEPFFHASTGAALGMRDWIEYAPVQNRLKVSAVWNEK